MATEKTERQEGLFSFEERIASQMESLISELDSQVAECEGMAGSLRDVSKRGKARETEMADLKARLEKTEEELELASAIDPLTGLYNRPEILKRVKQEKSRADRSIPPGEPGFALMLLDLDDFKSLNANYGLQAGDRLLKRFGSFIRSSIRSYDVAGRFAGDEFLALLPGASKEQAIRVASTVYSKLSGWAAFRRDAVRLSGKGEGELPPIKLGCAIGITDYRSEGRQGSKDAESIVAQAEYALYRARRSTAKRYAVWGEAKGKRDE